MIEIAPVAGAKDSELGEVGRVQRERKDMDLIRDKRTGRIICKDDPELWVQPFHGDPRLDLPGRFILSIDGRRIGFALGETLSGTPFSEAEQREFDRPTMIIRRVGLRVKGQVGVNALETNASKFASREQQDRAIQFFLGAVEHMLPGRHVTGEILPPQARFAPVIWVRFEKGDFIE